jgi:hypothetical protein
MTSELPARSNGYPVVAQCTRCHNYLTLWKDYRDLPFLAHTANLESKCPIWFYAQPDRPVPELGILHESNANEYSPQDSGLVYKDGRWGTAVA